MGGGGDGSGVIWILYFVLVVLYGFCTLYFFFIVGVSNFLYVILICVYIIFMY